MKNINKKLNDKQLAILLALIVSIMPFSTDTYLSVIPEISNFFNASLSKVEKSLTVFFLGVAIGQFIGGAYADIKSRKDITIVGLIIYLVSNILIVLLHDVDIFLFLRFLSAFGAGMMTVTVGAVVNDYYNGKDAVKMFAMISIITMIAPALAPSVGSIIEKFTNWHGIFIFLVLYALFIFIGVILFYPKKPKTDKVKYSIIFIIKKIITNYINIFKKVNALSYLLIFAFNFSLIPILLTESAVVYRKVFSLTSMQFSLIFLCHVIALAILNRITVWRLKYLSDIKNLLYFGLFSQFILLTILLIYINISNNISLLIFVSIMVTMFGLNSTVLPISQTMYLSKFNKENSGSASAVFGVSFTIMGMLFSFLATILHNGKIWPMVFTMWLTITLSLLCLIFFVLLRKKIP